MTNSQSNDLAQLTSDFHDLKESFIRLEAKVDTAVGKLDAVHYSVMGNGDQKKGLSYRVGMMEDRSGTVSRLLWMAAPIILSALVALGVSKWSGTAKGGETNQQDVRSK